SHPEVKEVHIVRLRTILGLYTGDFHILVDPQMTVFEAHEVSEKVKQDLENEGIFRELIIHLEPFTLEESLEGKSGSN
ncbi:MAG: cation-efflux pump, partial [Candidatus Heimdallarchaeota archaeon]|nr:cation-efflux pump [Candidatus Heimdallarchaeota archaeon]